MNKEFLNALIKDREESADMLEKPSMKGMLSYQDNQIPRVQEQ